MRFWINFWTVYFFAAVIVFFVLAVIVSIGGFFDVRALFKSLTAEANESEDDSQSN